MASFKPYEIEIQHDEDVSKSVDSDKKFSPDPQLVSSDFHKEPKDPKGAKGELDFAENCPLENCPLSNIQPSNDFCLDSAARLDTPDTKKPGIVIQIVKEEGNLKMKQVTGASKVKSDPGNEQELWFYKCPKCDINLDSWQELQEHGDCYAQRVQNMDAMFLCCICEVWSKTLRHLLSHVKDNHPEIKIPPEYESLLYTQRKAILKIETAAKELITMKKYKAVTRLLNSSKLSLDSLKLDFFGRGETNIFRKFISVLYSRIKNTLTRHRQKLATKKLPRKVKKKSKQNNGIKRKKFTSKRSLPFLKVKSDDLCSSGFSSGDDVCLKNILKDSETKITDDGEIIGKVEPNRNDDEVCLQFYAVPLADDGRVLSKTEVDLIRCAVKQIWAGLKINLDSLSHIKIQRFEMEVDEVLPDNTVFCGYFAKDNDAVLNETKPLTEMFNDGCFLNDRIREHKYSKLKCDEDVKEDNVDFVRNYDSFDDDVEMSPSDGFVSSDDYDDGFDKATAYLSEHPDVLFRNRRHEFKAVCKICGSRFTARNDFTEHIEMHKTRFTELSDGEFACNICGLRLRKSGRLLVHLQKAHRYSKQCEVCCEKFTTFDGRLEHFKGHLDEIMSCGICKKTFDEVFELREHFQATHTVRQDYYSNAGHRASAKTRIFRRKGVKCSKESTEAPGCKLCERKFTSIGRLRQHNSVVHGGVPFRRNKNNTMQASQDEVKEEMD